MPAFLAALSTLLAVVLATAAAHKWIARDRLALATSHLTRMPPAFARVLSLCAAGWEALAALALVVPATRLWGALLASGLWSLYALLTWRAQRAGHAFDCGCSFTSRKRSADPLTVARAITLALFAALAALVPGDPLYDIASVLAGIAFFILAVAGGELADLAPLRRRLVQ